MAASSNGTGNLVEDFEEAFQACLNCLTKQETAPSVEKEEVKVEVERFIDIARQMEAFFLQKRFILCAMKPELLIKEDNNELKCELQRKEELLKRHYDKIGPWQSLLADLQGHAVYAKNQQQSQTTATGVNQSVSPMPASCSVQQSVQVPMSQQMAAAAAQQQAMQQQALQQQQMQSSIAQGMYMHGGRGNYGNTLQGPLAYLEKTATNIDMVGMADGRR